MDNRIRAARALLFVAIALACASTRAADSTVEQIVRKHEAQWNDVQALRFDYSQQIRTTTANQNYDRCSWEMVDKRAHIVELRAVPVGPQPAPGTANATPAKPTKTVRARSECYYDGAKTYELVIPVDEYPLESVELEDYYKLRKEGVRASLSSQNKHWKFWSMCPTPRYFSVPTEDEPKTLQALAEKYESRFVKRLRNERGDELVQLEIKDDPAEIAPRALVKSWTLYVSLNMTKGAAISRYQLSMILNREPETKVVSEYSATGSFKECRPGLWFPSIVETSAYSGTSRISQIKTTIRSATVNSPSDDFDDFHFPKNLVVFEDVGRDAEGRPLRAPRIWGDDNAPAVSFETEDEFNVFYEATYGPDEEPAPTPTLGRRARLLLFVGVAFVVVVALFGACLFFEAGKVKDD